MDAGRLLVDARNAAGLTQAELATLAGTSQTALSAYERGRKAPTASTLARLLAAAGMRLTASPASTRVLTPTPDELASRGRVLSQVLTLAESLPARHRGRLAYPPLGSIDEGDLR